MTRSIVGRPESGPVRSTARFVRSALVAGALLTVAGPGWAADWRALVVGLSTSGGGGSVRGAVAGAVDLAGVLRARGNADVTLLTEEDAGRGPLLAALDGLVARTRAGDVVLFAFDGLGRRGGGVNKDDLAVDLLLPGAADPDHLVSGGDLAGFIRRVEDRGGRAVVLADASFGTQTTRGHGLDGTAAPAGGPPAGLLVDPSAPTPFARSLVLAASDPRFASRAVDVPGVAGPRRALTYAVARALEGRADFDGDGEIAVPELVAYAARLVYQLSDQRQKLAAVWPRDSLSAAGSTTRGIVIRATAPLGDLLPPAAAGDDPPLLRAAPAGNRAGALASGPPIRLAAATGPAEQLAGVAPREAAVTRVARTEEPDLIWDPGSRDVITPDGDMIAEQVDVGDLDGVVDRTMALRQLKQMVVEAPQQIAVLPDDEVQRRGSRVKVEIGNAAGRYLVLFNIRSDGAVQPLYPQPNDPPLVTTPAYTLPLAVNAPLGADQIVAVTSGQRLAELEKGLADMAGQKTPMAAVRLLRDRAGPGALVGSVGIFSGTP